MILVTGASGFVGNSLVRWLVSNGFKNDILAASRRLLLDLPKGVKQLQVEDLVSISDLHLATHKVTTIVHCAARVHILNEVSPYPLLDFRRVNYESTLSLANQAARAGVKRFVFLSSIKVNGEATEHGSPYTADGPLQPRDPYGVSKMEAEVGLRRLSAITGMEVVIIRPPLVYGPGVKGNFAAMLRWLRRGLPLPLGGLTDNRRSFVYIENLVDLIRVCLDHPKAANETFLVSDDEDISTVMLLQKMSKALDCSVCLVNVSPPLIKFAAKIIGKTAMVDRLCDSLQVDIKKTKVKLDWEPKFSLDEGLLATARSIN